jgi:cytochrome c
VSPGRGHRVTVGLIACAASTGIALAATPPDPARDTRAFAKCYACHSLDPAETGLPGPTLHRLFGRRAGSLPGYEFSETMVEAGRRQGLVWTPETLDRFLADPEGTLPGTLMGFIGLRDAAERKALIEYLQRATQ